jgi:hypothetical protein
MQTTETYLGLLGAHGKKGLPVQRVYRQLFNPHLYLTAYGKIYRNAGAMTRGVSSETADAMSLEKIKTINDTLRIEIYLWKPAKRVYILNRTKIRGGGNQATTQHLSARGTQPDAFARKDADHPCQKQSREVLGIRNRHLASRYQTKHHHRRGETPEY